MKLGLPTDVDNLPKRIWLLEWTYHSTAVFGPTIWPYALRMVKGRQKYMALYWSQQRLSKLPWKQIQSVVADVLGMNHAEYPWTVTNTELEQLQNAIALTTAISNIKFEPIYVQQKNLPTVSSFTINNILNTFVRIY